MSRTTGTGKSKLAQVASKLEGHSPHAEITGVKKFDTKPKMMTAGLNAVVSEQAAEVVASGETEVATKGENNNATTPETHQSTQAVSTIENKEPEKLQQLVNSSQQEVIVHKRRANRSIFIQEEEKVSDTKGMSFQVDLELIPIIKKYTKWGKGYKTINLMLISTLLDNEDVVEDLLKNDIVTYNTLIRLEEKYQKKLLEEY